MNRHARLRVQLWRALLRLAVPCFLVLGIGAPAQATLVSISLELDILGTTFVIPGNPDPVNVSLSQSGGSYTAITLPAGVISAAFIPTPALFAGLTPLSGLTISLANSAGILAAPHANNFPCPVGPAVGDVCLVPGAVGLGGTMPLAGNIRASILGLVFASLTPTPIGAGGTTSTPIQPGLTLVLRGATWTSGSAKVFTAAGTPTARGSNSTAAGTLQLVTPIYLALNPDLPGFATLGVTLVPEPSTGLLLAVAAASLVVLGRTKRRGR